MADFAPESLKASEFVTRPVWSILSKGINGTGKTILSCSPYFRPTYVFNLEGRFESVAAYYKKLGGVNDLDYNNFSMGSGNYYKIKKKMEQILNRPEYKTVVVSSLTSYIHIVMKNLMAGTKTGGKMKAGIPANTQEDYLYEDSAIIFELLGFLQELKENGVNIILEAHISPYEITTIEEGSRVSQTIYQIVTKGKKAPAQIPNYFNEIWHFKKVFPDNWGGSEFKKASYIVDTIGDSSIDCKTSFGIEPFDWTGIDPGTILEKQLNPDIAKEERKDPNAPTKVTWG